MEKIVVSGSFDNLKSRDMRFLEEAAKFGPVHVYLWSDEVVKTMTGAEPKFPIEERRYFLEAVRYVYKVRPVDQAHHHEELPVIDGFKPRMWVVSQNNDTSHKRAYCLSNGIVYSVIEENDLQGFPIQPIDRAFIHKEKSNRHRLLRLVPFGACTLLRGNVRVRRFVRGGGAR